MTQSDESKKRTKKKKKESSSLRTTRMISKFIRSILFCFNRDKERSGLQASWFTYHTIGRFLSWKPQYDICLVVPEKSRGWILEGVCLEIAKHSNVHCHIAHNLERLPKARGYFFSHYHFMLTALEKNPFLWRTPKIGWFTHPKSEHCVTPGARFAFKRSTVLTMCSLWAKYLESNKIPTHRIATLVAGADPELFTFHKRGSGVVGLCCNYYERKSPDRIVELIASRPDTKFILLGRGWLETEQHRKLSRLSNFEYQELDYQDYPAFYKRIDVIVSLSELEGGPIPILEGMMSNVVPVATKTGFAPDLIQHGENGFLCEINASNDVVQSLIDQALNLKTNVRETVLQYTWKAFSDGIVELLGVTPSLAIDQSLSSSRGASEARESQTHTQTPTTQRALAS
jgi:glycosyltransferase involved in cell wall biosynthesis